MIKKLLGLTVAGMCAAAGAVSSMSFSFPAFGTSDPIQDKFTNVHFFTPGNDYAGAFFWFPTVQVLPSVSVSLGSDTRYCTKQVRGLYFSNAWGNRLWPMDQQSLSGLIALDPAYSGLSMAGSFYTSCTNPSNTGALELYSVYGQVKYTRRSKEFSISMGRRYTVDANSTASGGPFVSSVQYFNNQTPLGYIFDNIAGVGFIGGLLSLSGHDDIMAAVNSGGYIDNIFTFATGSKTDIVAHVDGNEYSLSGSLNGGLDTLWRIAVLGNILLSKGGLGESDRRSILGNPNQGSSILVSDKMNISNSINQLKRSASALCRGKKVYDESTWRSSPSGVVCIGSPSDDFNESSPVEIDLTNTASYAAKTFIVYGKNIVLSGSMPQSSTIALNLFADRANVLLQHPSADVYFDKDGNLGDGTSGCTTGLTCTRGVYLRGNIFINGLLFGESGTAISHKVFVHGKFASLNTGLEPTTERKTQIQSLFDNSYTSFGSSINSTYCAGVNCINFNNVFNRECELSGLGNDGVVCNIPGDRFKYNPFIVIDTTIPTTLLQ